jgi:hypothetical protein
MVPTQRLHYLVPAGAAWLFVVAAGSFALWRYEATPGPVRSAPLSWPVDSRILTDPERANLVMFVHPHCPCTRASIGELARILARSGDSVRAHLFFVKPLGAPPGWEQTDLWENAAFLPGAYLQVDEGGVEAQRFGAVTSGQVVLYACRGALLFDGGITALRGHWGDNAGSQAILERLADSEHEPATTTVYGCPLKEPCPLCNELSKP